MQAPPALAALAVLLAASLALAGCSGGPAATTGPDGQAVDADGRPVDADGRPLPAPAHILAPQWQVGQAWTHAWSFGASEGEDFVATSVVAAADATGYTVATPDRQAAAVHGAFVFPTLGTFARADLTATHDGGSWPWYRFPLTENLTWQAQVSSKDAQGGTFQQSWSLTARNVTAAHADIVARADGGVVARYDFDNATGWFRDARFYGPDGNQTFHLRLKEATTGFKGTVYDATGDLLLAADFQAVPGQGSVDGEPATTFQPAADHTDLLAFPYAFEAGGASATTLVAPNGTAYPLHTDPAQAGGASAIGAFLLIPSAPGTWTFGTAGAGAFAWGGGVMVYGVAIRALTV